MKNPVTFSYEGTRNGVRVARDTFHASKASYTAAVNKRFSPLIKDQNGRWTNRSAPVAEGAQIEFHPSDLHEEIRKDGRHSFITGRSLLGPVIHPNHQESIGGQPVAHIALQGSRLFVGFLSPDYIGGMASLTSKEFQRHKFRKLRLMYVPNVPTTTAGAIMMYITNDVATSLTTTGQDELAHAATSETAIQTPIWESAHLDFRPKDLANFYQDNADNAALEIQGMVVVESASFIDFDSLYPAANTDPGIMSLGNLYLDYELEFYVPQLSYVVPERDTGSIILGLGAVIGLPVNRSNFRCAVGVVSAYRIPGMTLNGYPQGVTDPLDLVDYTLVTVMSSPIELALPPASRSSAVTPMAAGDTVENIPLFDPSIGSTFNLKTGVCFVWRFFVFGGALFAVAFPDMESASSATEYDPDISFSDAVAWDGYDFAGKPDKECRANGYWHMNE